MNRTLPGRPDRSLARLPPQIALCIAGWVVGAAFCCVLGLRVEAQVNVLTYHNDLARTGQNTNETQLTLANVNPDTFGRLFSCEVDGQVYTQPLYVSGMAIPGRGNRNVIFIATQHNSVYAFDADDNSGPDGGLLWQTNLGPSAATPNNDFGNRYGPFRDVTPEIGITSTPVIELAAGTIYLDAFTHEGAAYFHRIHALNITNGAEQPFSPVAVTASMAASGAGSTNGLLSFNAVQHIQRTALTLAGGVLYVAFAGYGDTDPYHGWVIGFDHADLHQLTNYVFNTTPNSTTADFGPNAGEGGIWMSGCGLAADAATNLYLIVGNGIFNGDTNGTEYGDSFVKLTTSNGLAVADYFTPFNQADLAENDRDLGSGGPLLLPDCVGSSEHPHLMVGCGKEGRLYLLDRDNLGHFNPGDDHQVVQSLPHALPGAWSSPAYFNGRLYYQAINDVMKAFQFADGRLVETPVSQSQSGFGYPGATPSVSANGTNDAIVWALQPNGYASGWPATLRAYNATNLSQELYASSRAGIRDKLGPAIKFAVPTIANGKVYVGSDHSVSVFGTGIFISPPVIDPPGGLFTNSATISLSNPAPGVSLYYTLDGSVPWTNSALYIEPFVVTNTAVVSARAIQPGAVPSTVSKAVFIDTASATLTSGFLRHDFYSGQSLANLDDFAMASPSTFTRYLAAFETPSLPEYGYVERVSGYFIPPQSGNYVFFVCSGGRSDFYLSTNSLAANKHLIACETSWSSSRRWVSSAGGSDLAAKRSDQFAGTTWPGGHTIALKAGKRYYLEGVHYQAGGGANFAATFKLATEGDPTDGDPPRLAGGVISTEVYDNTTIRISSPPPDAVVRQGERARFTIGAVSSYVGAAATVAGPPLSYQWQTAPADSLTFTNLLNATNSSYLTPPLTAAMDGAKFRAVLSTLGATATSSAANLTVLVPPAITLLPASATGAPSSSVRFSVTAMGTPALAYQWLKDGTNLCDDLRITGAAAPALVITNLQADDAGSYAVIITNIVGSVTSSPPAMLTVKDLSPPMLAITSHTNFQVLSGTSILLAGTATDGQNGDQGIASVTVNSLAASNGTAGGSDLVLWSRTVPLAAGTNTIKVVATDNAGNSATTLIVLVSDSTRPTLFLDAPASNSKWSNAVVAVSGRAKDNLRVTAVWCQGSGGWQPASTTNGWTNWTVALPSVPGTNLIRAYAEDQAGNKSDTNAVSGVFVAVDRLALRTSGSGTVSPNYSNALLSVGAKFTLTASPRPGSLFSNWVGSVSGAVVILSDNPKLTFVMQSNLVLQANFTANPFFAAAGTWQGLFFEETAVALDSSGFFSATVTSNGTFSATFQQGNSSYRVSGRLSFSGAWSTNVLLANNPTALWLQLDLAGGDSLTGGLSNANWSADLSAVRAAWSRRNPPPFQGHYTLVLPGADSEFSPAGHGYGTATVDATGNLSLSAVLGDGTTFSQTAIVSRFGQSPLYRPLYSGRGALLGWLTFTNAPDRDLDGLLSWIKLPNISSALYRDGFTNELEIAGSRYLLSRGTRVLNLTNGMVVLEYGNLSSGVTNTFTLAGNNRVMTGNRLSLTIAPSTGLFQGRAPDPAGKLLAIRGALLQKQNAGFGQFTGTNQTGSVLLTPH